MPISFADSRFYRVFSSFVDRFLRSFFDRLVIFLCEWGLHTARYNCGQKLTGQNAATLGALASESFTSEAHFWCLFFSAVQSCAIGSLSCSQMVRLEEVRYARTHDFPNFFIAKWNVFV